MSPPDVPRHASANATRHCASIARWSSVLALIWVVAARVLGPCDMYDQTQPRTAAYTTDIIVHGRWLLPIERGNEPATKPPLYNWLAVPAVKLLGFSSDFAHKLPSLLAMIGCWLALVRLGRHVYPHGDAGLGWLAGLMFLANYTVFKLGYLARPDMLLTLWLTLGWIAATWAIADPPGRRSLRWLCQVGFWCCFALAAMTKGPPAVILLAYALLLGRSINGRWSGLAGLRWSAPGLWLGLLLGVAVFGGWVFLIYRIDPDHVTRQLWFDELVGRVTGTGSEGTGGRGPIEFLERLAHMPAYFMIRFAPWSLLTVLAVVLLWRRGPQPERRRQWHRLPTGSNPDLQPVPWLHGAAINVVLVIVFFTLSAGKRADYLAVTLAPASLLAAWYAVERWPARWRWWTIPVVAATALLSMTVYNQGQLGSPQPGFGPRIHRFIREVDDVLQAKPLPVVFIWAGESQLQGHLGYSEVDGPTEIFPHLKAAQPFWVVAGRRLTSPETLPDLLTKIYDDRPPKMIATEICSSPRLPRVRGWKDQVTLYRMDPAKGRH